MSATNAVGASSQPSEHIQVLVRCRPINEREAREGQSEVVFCSEKQRQLSVHLKQNKYNNTKTFSFDAVFGPETTQREVFVTAIQPIVDQVLNGYNCTIFVYGSTGTGKTYTMEGPYGLDKTSKAPADRYRVQREMGIIYCSAAQIFEQLDSSRAEYSVRVSHLELYKEDLCDLLNPSNIRLKICEDPRIGGIQVSNLSEVIVYEPAQILDILQKSWEERKTAETQLNKHSSRSHCIFSITIHTKESSSDGEDLIKIGKLNLVDLAGSENVNRSGTDRDTARKQEAGNINKSLLTLGRVITALTEGAPHIPYRESKLTRLLRESLGGRTKTCIIATVSPCSGNLEETLSTLDYASRAKNIKNRPEVNQKMAKREVIKEYATEISSLRAQLQAMRSKEGVKLSLEMWDELQGELKTLRETRDALEEAAERRDREIADLQSALRDEAAERSRLARALSIAEDEIAAARETAAKLAAALAAAQSEIDETRAILAERVMTETMLRSHLQQLVKMLTASVGDAVLLHDKARDQSALAVSEARRIAGFCANTVDRLSGVQDALARDSDASSEDLAAVADRMEASSREVQSATLVVVQTVTQGMEQLKTTIDNHANASIATSSDTSTRLQALIDATASGIGAALESLKAWHGDLSGVSERLLRCSDTWSSVIAKDFIEASGRLSATSEATRQAIDDHVSMLSRASELVAEGSASSAAAIKEDVRSMLVYREQAERTLSLFERDIMAAVRDATAKFAASERDALDAVINGVAARLTSQVTSIGDLAGRHSEATACAKSSAHTILRGIRTGAQEASAACDLGRTHLGELRDRLTTQAEDICKDAARRAEDLQGAVSSVHRRIQAEVAEVAQDVVEATCQAAEQHREAVAKIAECVIADSTSASEASRSASRAALSAVGTGISTALEASKTRVAGLRSAISKTCDDLGGFSMAVPANAGDTPMREAVVRRGLVPKAPSSKPDDQIIAEVRKKKASAVLAVAASSVDAASSAQDMPPEAAEADSLAIKLPVVVPPPPATVGSSSASRSIGFRRGAPERRPVGGGPPQRKTAKRSVQHLQEITNQAGGPSANHW